MHTCMLFLFTSYVSQLSVEKAMASNATATMADIVASDNVTAEHGILFCVCCVVVFAFEMKSFLIILFTVEQMRNDFDNFCHAICVVGWVLQTQDTHYNADVNGPWRLRVLCLVDNFVFIYSLLNLSLFILNFIISSLFLCQRTQTHKFCTQKSSSMILCNRKKEQKNRNKKKILN